MPVEERIAHPAVDASVLGNDRGVVLLNNHEGGEHAHSPSAEGGHDGVHLCQLGRKVHLLDEIAV